MLVRYVAPAAFLLAVTAVVLVVRSALRPGHPATTTTPEHVTTRRAPVATPTDRAVTAKRWYVIQSGDTLDAIAARFRTTVARLLRLNPGIDPRSLRPGTQLRIE